jgi:hypothetical protein
MPSLHTPVLIRVPGMVQAQVYFPPGKMSPAFAEHLSGLVEAITGLAFSHAIRDAFPALRRRSVAEEAAAAWAAPRRRFRISNGPTDPQHIQLLAGVLPRVTDAGRESYGYLTLHIRAGAEAASAVAENLDKLATECDAVYARADAPTWGVEASDPQAFATLAIPAAGGWLLAERLGWVTCLSAAARSCIDGARMQALSALGVQARDTPAGGCVLRLSAEPMDDRSPQDLARYRDVRSLLAGAFPQAVGA